MTVWASFYDHILPELNGITPAVVDFTLRDVCRDFCEETGVHATEVTAINVVAGTSAYTLTSPVSGTEPHRIKAAWFNGHPLHMAPEDALNASSDYWPDSTSTEPWAYTQKQPDQIILYPEPDTAVTDGLRVQIILKPTTDSTGLTDWIALRYMRQLAHGVKARLMAQPGRPWTNPDFAAYHNALYESAKTLATIDANRSFTRGALTVAMRPAYRGGWC